MSGRATAIACKGKQISPKRAYSTCHKITHACLDQRAQATPETHYELAGIRVRNVLPPASARQKDGFGTNRQKGRCDGAITVPVSVPPLRQTWNRPSLETRVACSGTKW